MLISEVRELLKKYKEEDLRLLISEMYKSMPKKLREEKDIDSLLQDVHAHLRLGKVQKIKDNQIEIKDLKLADILDSYIIECYDVLHTLGNEYLMEDITEVIKNRGIKL